MKIEALTADAVRSTERSPGVSGLTTAQLGHVVGAGPTTIPGTENCPNPDLCAIHDYYFSDTVE